MTPVGILITLMVKTGEKGWRTWCQRDERMTGYLMGVEKRERHKSHEVCMQESTGKCLKLMLKLPLRLAHSYNNNNKSFT